MRYPEFTGSEPCTQIGADWFAVDEGSKRYKHVKQIRASCMECPMHKPCLEYALAVRVDGFWGGMTDGERHRERKRLGITPLPLLEAM